MSDDRDQDHEPSPLLAAALARGRAALIRLMEDAGGLWSEEEAAQQVGVPPVTVREWLREGRLLTVQCPDGSEAYPIAQFEPWRPGLAVLRPVPAIAAAIETAGDYMTSEELAGFLATPRRSLAVVADLAGGPSLRLRTGFQALAEGDSDAVLAVIRRVTTPADADAQDLSIGELLVEGHEALIRSLEEAGGLWTVEEVARQLGATPATIQEWLQRGRLLAVRRIDGAPAFPAAQFERHGPEGHPGARSFACIEKIIEAAGDMNREELAGLLATPQESLAVSDGTNSTPRARTGFEAIADRDCSMLLRLVSDLAVPADEGAPPMPENWPH